MNDDAKIVFDGVRRAILDTFRLPADAPISRDTTSADVAGWDSLSHSMLLMRIEEILNIELPLDRVYNATSVGHLVDLIVECRAAP